MPHYARNQVHVFTVLLVFLIVLVPAGGLRAAPGPAAQSSHAQANIMQEVHHQLVMLPYFSVFDNLEYRVDGTTVTLMGQVTQPVLKSDAEKAVKSIESVTAVNNQIEVLPVSMNDDQIRRAEFRAIYTAPNFEQYSMQAVAPIHIVVKGGNVTLEGVVANDGDRDLANIRARGVPGVFSVTNNLRTDKEMKSGI
jgi:hyperosmotically inducible periplasmic protein